MAENNLFTWGLVGAGIFFGVKYLKSHTFNAKDMRIKMQGFHVTNDGMIAMDILMQNPNSTQFEVKSVLGQVFVNGSKVADIDAFGDNIIQGNSQGTIPLTALVNVRGIFDSLMSAMRRGNNKILLQGTMNINNNTVPFKINYTA